MKQLQLIEFIKDNPNDWQDLLSNKPYCLNIKEKGNLIIFKYNMIDSDMSQPICQECRGIILERDTWKVVRCAFFKFFNYGETLATSLNLNNFRVEEKIDGSLISLYYYGGKWNIATNGMIDAHDSELQFQTKELLTFYDLFKTVDQNIDYQKLNINYTYTFEIISIYNKVVIPYPYTKIFHIGTRDNNTLEELLVDIGIEKPSIYKFNSIEDIINNAKELPYDEEGYVAVDDKWNRIKIKSPAYVAIHHMKENGKVSPKRILTIVQKGEREEFINYFPEYTEEFNKIETLYNQYIKTLKLDLEEAKNFKYNNRKEFALWATKKVNSNLLFSFIDGKISTVEQYISNVDTEKLSKWLNLLED